MKKSLFQKAILLIVMFVLLMPTALADTKRGDRGNEVQWLQQLLFESGWLFEEPDGVFGRNTEEAVKNFERYAGLKVDGIADEEMFNQLYDSWATLNGVGDAEETPVLPACCIVYQDGNSSYTEYCELHQPMCEDSQRMPP